MDVADETPPPAPGPQWFTVHEVADRIRMSPSFVYGLIRSNKIGYAKHGRKYLFSPAHVDCYLASVHGGVTAPEPEPAPEPDEADAADPLAPPTLSVSDVALLLGRGPGHVRELMARGRLPYHKATHPRLGVVARFHARDVATYLEKRNAQEAREREENQAAPPPAPVPDPPKPKRGKPDGPR